MEGDVAGVRITPPIVEFVDVAVDELYSTNIAVQNVSKFSKKIRFHAPVTRNFKLTVKNPEKPIAPGLEIYATVEYEGDAAEDARDRIILAVDDDVIEIPLYAYTPTPLLDIEGPVDFGMVVAHSRVISQEVALINHGSISGTFSISYDGKEPIVISPTSGEVNPKTIQLIKVDLVTDKPGVLKETATVKLEGMKDTKLEIKGCIVDQCLQFLANDKETSLSCIKFGPAFYGTDRIEKGFLFNNGPEPVKWVSILEEGADGEEAGTDLTKSTAAMLATSPMERIRGRAYDVLTSLVSAFPNQGLIGPYQKVPINFRFSPRFNSCNIGWEANEKPPPRQDFALFMTFEMVGSNDSFMSDIIKPNKKIEVAVTGTAVPVLINIQPSNTFDFGEVMCGDHSSTLCTISNESASLPINISCRKVAHYNVVPNSAKIGPGKSQDLLISFQPNQPGKFQLLQVLDVIGKVCDVSKSDDEVTKLCMKPFQTIPIQLIGSSIAPTKSRAPVINPGITPLVNNETGLSSDVPFNQISKVRRQVRSSTINATKTMLHLQSGNISEKAFIAFPNDRAQSIRPSKRDEDFQTPYTRAPRHTYVDPDYTYTAEEEEAKRKHKEKYKQFLKEMGQKRKEKEITEEFNMINNERDLAIKPANGLVPPKLTVAEIEASLPNQPSLKEKHRLLTTRQLVDQEQKATTRPVSEGLNAVPTTYAEKSDCKRRLSPQDLHKVIIGPPTIDFGEVCLRSTNYKQLHIVNNLNHFVHVQVLINCKELRQTSPLSQVIPALSKAQFTLVFESNTEGKFQRSISYSVNSQHESHVLVLANIVSVALELSETNLELTPEPGLPAEAGYRSTVTLLNRRNYPADFTWSPILSDRGTAFSIRPATGTVDAYKDLKCEVVFHPSYFAPLEGEFHMQVHNGNSTKLKCSASLGPANVKFIERRIMFGKVPLNMRTVKTALLRNPGPNHAMFYVINSTPFPGMTVTPTHGIVPVGGNAEFKVSLLPTAVVKFDTWIQVNIRGWKTIELRMGGTVEPPEVDIDVKAFKFNGVYCDSTVSIPFNLINLTSTRVCAEMDLSKYSDFTLSIPDEALDKDPSKREESSLHKYFIELNGDQSLPCQLIFNPTSVASYDFTLPVVINNTGAPSPAPSTFPPTPVPSERHIITPRPMIVTVPTPRRRVVATALRPTLILSTQLLKFSLPVTYMEMQLSDDAGGDQQSLTLTNTSDEALTWEISTSSFKSFTDDCAFAFVKPGGAWFPLEKIAGTLQPLDSYKLTVIFSPKKVGKYLYTLPVFLNGGKSAAYRHITLDASLQAPNIVFDPLALVLTPVPLATAVFAEFNMTASGYIMEHRLKVDVPDVEADDGTTISCFSLEFPRGSCIPAVSSTGTDEKVSVTLPCVLTFNSHKPVSATIDITITDEAGRRFCIPVTATADNCLLTVYPFLAAHRNDHQIVCEQDKSLRGPAQDSNSASLGEAILLPCTSPTRPSTRGSTSVTSSHFGTTSSSYDDSTNSVSESEFLPSSRDGAQPTMQDSDATTLPKRPVQPKHASKEISQDVAPIQKLVRMSQKNTDESTTQRELVSRSLGSAVFPFESSMEAHFHHEVLMAAQRWFSAHGWPGGPFPIVVPHTIRNLISRDMSEDEDVGAAVRKHSRTSTSGRPLVKSTVIAGDSNLRKDVKTIYDMLQHLCGRVVPGIPINQPLPADPTERVLQLHWMHSTLLTFLRGQGASVSAIRPEFLMTPRDYRCWVKVRERATAKREAKREVAACEEGALQPDGSKTARNDKEPALSTINIEEELFESVSKRAWTDLLLQLFKVLVLARVTPHQYAGMKALSKSAPLPKVNPDPLVSNVYGVGERIILAWLNHHYGQQRHVIWKDREALPVEKAKGGLPPSRWVVNFDYDLLDGLVLASVLAAYCPWLVPEHFSEMYTSPASPEQCLHNTLILVKALRRAGIDYDIQATDITDPNPITLLMLSVYLYQNLPQYAAKSKVHFVGALHATIRRQVRLTNPSSKALKYFATISGRDAADFHLSKGGEICLPPKSVASLEVVFTSRLIRPAEAVLVLVGRRENGKLSSTVGSTLVFMMDTAVDDIHPSGVVRAEAPCYELRKISIPVTNPFNQSGTFRIVLVESSDGPPSPFDIGHKYGKKSSRKTLSTRIKSVKSRTDHGQVKEPSPPSTPPQEERIVPEKKKPSSAGAHMTSQLTSLYCHQSEIYLERKQTTTLQLDFLPFSVGKKYCSVLLVNENIGEFLYAVEAISILPLPSAVPHSLDSQHSVRISSAAAPIKSGKSVHSDHDNIVYWKCENNSILQENFLIPVTNESKERALRMAARQRMSKKEEQRRLLTGTLDSGSVTAAIAAMGMMNVYDHGDAENKFISASAPPPPRSHKFTVESSSQWFQVPDSITIPSPMTFGPPPASEMKAAKARPNDRQNDGNVPLQIRFEPRGPGHYPCDLILRAPGDIRLYRIDCTVNPAGTTARLDFRTPAHQSITQNIPIQNASNHDWDLECIIEADGFYGPSHMTARAGQTTYYPLMFKPHYECTVTGKLTIKNKSGTEHLFSLCGVGDSPLALEHIDIPCKCREVTKCSVKVPNYAPHKLAYKVLTDIDCLEGDDLLTVLKNETAVYNFTVSPWKRGSSSGVLAFIIDDMEKSKLLYKEDSDSDNEEEEESEYRDHRRPTMEALSANEKTPAYLKPKLDLGLSGYRVWFSVDIHAAPADPIGVIDVECPVQGLREIEIPVNNPSGDRVEFDVKINGNLLTGDSKLVLAPRIPSVYKVSFKPFVIGESEGEVVFSSSHTGEFWYRLKLRCVSPPPTTLPAMECQLGRWSRQYISVCNPTEEPMEVEATISNEVNFSLDVPLSSSNVMADGGHCFIVQPKFCLDLPIQFMPTSLGAYTHQGKITLKSKHIGEAVYLVSGCGLAPHPMEPVSVSAAVGSSTSLILPFRNPTDVPVLVDVMMSDHEQIMNSISGSVIRNHVSVESAFCLLLKHSTSIRLEPRQTLDIPFTFSPDKMRRYEGALAISLRREDGTPWPDESVDPENFSGLKGAAVEAHNSLRSLHRADDGSVFGIRWIFPVHGIPEVRSNETKEAILQCQARSRIEERLEVTLTGALPSSATSYEVAKLRAVTPIGSQSNIKGVVVEGHSVADEFSYQIEYPEDGDAKQHLEQALAVNLIRKERDPHTGLVVLVFNLVFSPFRQLNHTITLTVTSATGGVWSFPVSIRASEPPPDDVISIEAAGLGKGSTVSFTMFSHSKHPTPFTTFFVPGSDPEFVCTPESGELQPQGTNGTRLSLTFTPAMYGRSYKARLIVQTLDMQWTYDVKGVTPEYRAPNVPSAIFTSTLSRPRAVMQRPRVNYVRKNLKLKATAVSSPIKGMRLNQIKSQ